MCNKGVQIEIVNETKQTQQGLLFLPAVECNVKGVRLAALGKIHLAPGARFQCEWSTRILISAMTSLDKAYIETQRLEAPYGSSWEAFSNESALDLRAGKERAKDNCIQVVNRYKEPIYVAGSWGENHLFACPVPPECMVEVLLRPKCAAALGDGTTDERFYDMETLKERFGETWSEANLTSSKNVRFTIRQDQETGKVTLHCDCVSR